MSDAGKVLLFLAVLLLVCYALTLTAREVWNLLSSVWE